MAKNYKALARDFADRTGGHSSNLVSLGEDMHATLQRALAHGKITGKHIKAAGLTVAVVGLIAQNGTGRPDQVDVVNRLIAEHVQAAAAPSSAPATPAPALTV